MLKLLRKLPLLVLGYLSIGLILPSYGHPVYPTETDIFQVISVNQFNPAKDYLWFIPQSEIDLNAELKQNPGY